MKSIASACMLLVFGFGLIIGAPALFDSSLSSLFEFLPDVSLMLGLSGILMLCYGSGILMIYCIDGNLK